MKFDDLDFMRHPERWPGVDSTLRLVDANGDLIEECSAELDGRTIYVKRHDSNIKPIPVMFAQLHYLGSGLYRIDSFYPDLGDERCGSDEFLVELINEGWIVD